MFFSPPDIAQFNKVPLIFIKTQKVSHVFTITLDRAEKRNAFTPTMVHEIAYALSYAEVERDIWCIVIKAEGPVFCAGMDLKVFQNPSLDSPNNYLPKSLNEINLGEAFRIVNKPIIAKLEGSVFAGGVLITCGCTFVIATDEVEFSLPEVKRGLFPMQVINSLLQSVTPKKALEICLLADTYSGIRAKEIGLLTHLVEKESLDDELNSLLEKLCSHAPFAIAKGMQTLKTLQDLPQDERFDYMTNQLNLLRNSEDAKEGIEAFYQNRLPVWKNQ